MAKYFRFPFAVSGNRTAVPETTQVNGNVSYQEGWPVGYQEDPQTSPTAKLINRQQTNQTLYDITLALQQYQQFGVPDFITAADNGGTPFSYSIGARVRYDPGSGTRVFESLVDSNTTLPTDANNWAEVPAPGGATGAVPIGGQIPYGGLVAPTGFVLCYGQALSRSTFAALFAVIGTRYGNGDGSTTFNVPDKRGRTSFGRDNMGPAGDGTGTPANRITNAVSNIVGTQVGTNGGSQAMPVHTHGVNDTGHTHPLPSAPLDLGSPGGSSYGGGTRYLGPSTATGSAFTGITIQNAGSGNSANMPPCEIDTWLIRVM